MKEKPNPPASSARDIAKIAGVHHSTVARAMRGDPRVKPATRDAIMSVAEQMRYTPNPYVTAFATQMRARRATPHRATIAALDTCDCWRMDGGYEKGILSRAADHGFSIDIIRSHELPGGIAEAGRVVKARGIRGFIVLPVLGGQPEFGGMDFRSLAGAAIDMSLRSPALHRACADYFQGVCLAADTLRAKGCKRIGFCTYELEINRIGRRWLGGYLAWREQDGGKAAPKPHINSVRLNEIPPEARDKHWRECRGAFKRWVEREKPDAIISNNIYFLNWLRELGYDVPGEINFASLSVGPFETRFSGICQCEPQIGAAAVDLVAGQLYRNEYGIPRSPMTVLVPSVWVDGDTTA